MPETKSMEASTTPEKTPARGKEMRAIIWALCAIVAGRVVMGGIALQESWAAKTPMTTSSDKAKSALDAVSRTPPLGGKRNVPTRGMAELLDSVTRRQSELEVREQRLSEREQQLALYEKDVTGKLAELEKLEGKLQEQADEARANSQEAADSLAKVYAAMKPADAAPILDKLDDATVLRIFKGMRAKQIGEILPLMSSDKAVLLTRSLATTG